MNLAIVNARYNSSRFPGKLMQPLHKDRTVLDLFLERIKKTGALDEIVLSTQDKRENAPLWKEADKNKVPVHVSSLPPLPSGAEDVLGRTKEVAEKYHANAIVRLTPDCPCLHSELINRVVLQYFMNRNGVGYATNCWYKGFPRGMEVEVLSRQALETAWEQTGGWKPPRLHWWNRKDWITRARGAIYDREHVTTFIRRFPRQIGHIDLPPMSGFKQMEGHPQGGMQLNEAFPECRLTLDYPADLEVLQNVYGELYDKDPDFKLMDIRMLWDSKRELFKANAHIEQRG